jgi:hypothetical protein
MPPLAASLDDSRARLGGRESAASPASEPRQLDGPWRVGEMLHPSPASPAANRGWQSPLLRKPSFQTQGIF